MKRTILSLSLVLLLALSACTTANSMASSTPSGTPSAAPTPVWNTQTFSKQYTAPDGTVVMTVEFKMPAAEDGNSDPAWTQINAYYEAEGNAYLENAQETADQAIDEYTVASASGYSFSPYSLESSYSVSYQDEHVVSFLRSYYSYIGGAHPSTFQFSEVFDLKSGQRLAFADLFSDTDAAQSKVLEAIHAQNTDSVYDETALDEQFNPDYFYLTDSGYVFYYQSETIAPHAAGIPEFTIPYADLQDLQK
ncbi:MAG: DUF3298 and DUF4163 domain-containing protein [Intestinimonas sp.]|jgi:hypothetical protein|nr:DUF3298 and DUF4163 domain-containing protein [Intestinimonas sp.]